MIFSQNNITNIADQIQHQFPDLYKQYGQGLIDFISAYYEWMDQNDESGGRGRSLYSQYDIDTVSDQFLIHFKNTYMSELPDQLLSNQRLMQKHILELYSSKGSPQAIRLLFRLLYNQNIDFYIPSYDIFTLSEGSWIQPCYLEVTSSPYIDQLINKMIVGDTSKATAIVEDVQKIYINQSFVNVLVLSNISGNFSVGEVVTSDRFNPAQGPIILGSVAGATVVTSTAGFNVGDVVVSTNVPGQIKAVVTEVFDGTGSLNFTIQQPGSYYSLDAVVSITTGANTTGAGADFAIRSLRNTFDYRWNSDKILPYANTALNATAYGFPALPTANSSTTIVDCLIYQIKTVGQIDTLQVINPGSNYDDNVAVSVIDPYTSTSGILNDQGVTVGTDAVISGTPVVGTNLVNSISVINSSYAVQQVDQIQFVSEANTQLTIVGTPTFTAVGVNEGYFDDTKSQLSTNKFLYDGHYYQEFSYVIKAGKMLDKYVDILKQVAHPSGNAVFGSIKIVVSDGCTMVAEQATVTTQ